jgi:hypothetical protein
VNVGVPCGLCWLLAALKEKAMPRRAKAKMLMANRIKIMTLTTLSECCSVLSSAGGSKGSVISIKFFSFGGLAGGQGVER